MVDPRTPQEVDEALIQAATAAADTLLVYYAGHGLPLPSDGSLHLAVGITDRHRLHSTAVPLEWIRSAVRRTDATAKVLILDCCFSGRAIQVMSADAVAEQLDVAGSYVLTAAPANKLAAAPQGETYTAFTGALIGILEEGIKGGPNYLDLDTIFSAVRKELRNRGLPEPQAQNINRAARLALAPNPAPVPASAVGRLPPSRPGARDHTVTVGFYLGTTRTVLASRPVGSTRNPAVLWLHGAASRHIPNVVAEHPDRGVLVGDDAWFTQGVTSRFSDFDPLHGGHDALHRPLSLFVTKVVADARAHGLVPMGKVRWVFGSGLTWSAQQHSRYADFLLRLGLEAVELLPTPCALWLHARDSGEVGWDARLLSGPVLIVDIHSGRTDYTHLVGPDATVIDHFSRPIGAALIDREILRRVLSRHPHRAQLEELMRDSPSLRRRVELSCQRSKEEYFSTPPDVQRDADWTAGTIQSVPAPDGDVFLDARLSKADMDEVLENPISLLGEASWSSAFRYELSQAMYRFRHEPKALLLAGGPSRMPFLFDLCKQELGSALKVLLSAEPEFAAARGLALHGIASR
jgi:Caspase domain